MTAYRILCASCRPVTDNWRTQLVNRLGYKPRRLSQWCELGLWGALESLAQVDQALVNDTLTVRVYTRHSTLNASLQALEQLRSFPPMPFTFLQTQPGQLLGHLGKALNWRGDGVVLTVDSVDSVVPLCSEGALQLIGWLDDVRQLTSQWLLLQRADVSEGVCWKAIDGPFSVHVQDRWLKYADGWLAASS